MPRAQCGGSELRSQQPGTLGTLWPLPLTPCVAQRGPGLPWALFRMIEGVAVGQIQERWSLRGSRPLLQAAASRRAAGMRCLNTAVTS